MKAKRADFISKSTDVRDMFKFAQPNQVLEAVRTYCCSMCGAMTWSLCSPQAMQVYNCWNTCVKLAWGLPRSTHSYFVDNLLSGGIPSVRVCLLGCFWKFFEGVLTSSSLEVRLVAIIASVDIRSTSGSNLFGVRKLCKIDKLSSPSALAIKSLLLQEVKAEVPQRDDWRIPFLVKYLGERCQLQAKLMDTSEVDSLIASLCSS